MVLTCRRRCPTAHTLLSPPSSLHTPNHPTNQPTTQPTNQPTDRPTDQWTKVRPAVNQCCLRVGVHDDAAIALCREHGIVYQGYSPLGHGTNTTAPPVLKLPDVIAVVSRCPWRDCTRSSCGALAVLGCAQMERVRSSFFFSSSPLPLFPLNALKHGGGFRADLTFFFLTAVLRLPGPCPQRQRCPGGVPLPDPAGPPAGDRDREPGTRASTCFPRWSGSRVFPSRVPPPPPAARGVLSLVPMRVGC